MKCSMAMLQLQSVVFTLPSLRSVAPGATLEIRGPGTVVCHESDRLWWKPPVKLVRKAWGWERATDAENVSGGPPRMVGPSGWREWARSCVASRAKAAARRRRGRGGRA